MKAPMTSKSDLGLFQIPNYRQGVRTLSLAAAIWMSTSLAEADTPVGGAGVLAGEVPQDLPANLGVTPRFPTLSTLASALIWLNFRMAPSS